MVGTQETHRNKGMDCPRCGSILYYLMKPGRAKKGEEKENLANYRVCLKCRQIYEINIEPLKSENP